MTPRFELPRPGAPAPVTLPPIERSTLASGLRVWTMPHRALPVASIAVIVDIGSVTDPADQPGLTGMTIDLMDEGAGGRDAIAIAEAMADVGATLEVQAGIDVSSLSAWTLARHAPDALRVIADVLARPHFDERDLPRVRELRLSRLQQLSRSPASAAERVFASAVFGAHGYGHSMLGTSDSVSRTSLGDIREHYERHVGPRRTTVIVVGDVDHVEVARWAEDAFGGWRAAGPIESRAVSAALEPAAASRVLLVERPGSAQSEIRAGHLAPPRKTPDYHALTLLNAGLGGSFSGRLNQRLRQQLGYTYGARSAFDLDRLAGAFECDTSVQSDKTADSVRELHQMLAAVRGAAPLTGDELEQARGSLTSGYARHFETPRQLMGAAAQLLICDLPDDTFDTFVAAIESLDAAAILRTAQERLMADRLITVVVGDPAIRADLEALGMTVEMAFPEF